MKLPLYTNPKSAYNLTPMSDAVICIVPHPYSLASFVSWLAWDGENIIGTSGMSFVEKPPYFGCPSGKMGLLSSMYTNPKYRRMGIARELLSRVVNDAREYGCGTIQITASDL